MQKRDNSNIDILKILAIIMIIAHHFVYDAMNLNIIDHSNLFYNFLYIGGKYGTVLFTLITGYFLLNKEFNIKKILRIIIKTEIYSYVILAIFIFILNYKIGNINILKSMISIISNRYWFITSYVILYFFSPYLNTLINNIDKKMYKRLLVLSTILVVILPTITFNYFVNNTICLIYFYLIGAYIRKFEVKLFNNNIFNILLCIIIYIMIYGSTIIINIFSTKYQFLNGKEFYFSRLNSILVVLSAIFCFVYFLRIKIKGRRIYSLLAVSTLGIYLLHDNFFIKKHIFPKLFEFVNNSNNIYLYSIITIIIVFITCFIIDTIISLPINRLINKIKLEK